jgi:rhodanese-related sulfurtransferase
MPDLTIDEAAALAPVVTPEAGIAHVAAGAVLIDVRGAESQERDGAILGAIAVNRNEIGAEFSFDSPVRHSAVESYDTPIVVVCGSVRGSGPVAAELIDRGFTNVTHVEGGYSAYAATVNGLEVPEAENCEFPVAEAAQ